MKDLVLNNGQKAIFIYIDDFSRPVYQLESGRKVCCINLNGTYLHSISGDIGEPDCPLKEEYQPINN
ncbi:hypothetical protein KFE26_23270 [Shewanella sp. M16]|uniref:hypothetical protein n=1 Tax=Shewanella sp. M16 TaxID=2830837 RepID=UPI001BB072C5|nr:hypothetical protein [Shewanella sp. M16]MBS0045168.1 hypothetical protein [Shewanella sp. M16]